MRRRTFLRLAGIGASATALPLPAVSRVSHGVCVLSFPAGSAGDLVGFTIDGPVLHNAAQIITGRPVSPGAYVFVSEGRGVWREVYRVEHGAGDVNA